MTTKLLTAVAFSALVFGLPGFAQAEGAGVSSDLTGQWWQWAVSIPTPANPLTETTGERCAVGQKGPIWFLGGDFTGSGEPVVRTCEIPPWKSVLMPVINAMCSTAGGDADPDDPRYVKIGVLDDCARELIDQVITAEAYFAEDSGPEEPLDVSRVRTVRPFDVSFQADNVLGFEDPNPSLAMAEGFWVRLMALPPGNYVLRVLGEFDAFPQDGIADFVQDVTYHLEVVEAE